jgi:cytochrome P450
MMIAFILYFICVFSLFILPYLFNLTRLDAQQESNLPPFGPKDRFLGLDFFFGTVYHSFKGDFFELTHRRFVNIGHTYRSRHFWRPSIHTNDPENIHHVLVENAKDFNLTRVRAKAVATEIGHGIFASDGSEWKWSRQLLRPFFNKSNLQRYIEILETHFQHLRQQIPENHDVVDLQDLFLSCAMNSSTEIFFGKSETDGLVTKKEFVESFTHLCLQIVRRLALGPLQFLLWDFTHSSRLKARLYLNYYVEDALRMRKEDQLRDIPNKKKTLVQALAAGSADPNQIHDQLQNTILASRDTTGSLLSNLFFELIRNTEVWEKLQAEIEHLDMALLTPERLGNLTYLNHCILECK